MCFKALERAGKERIIIENKCTLTTEYENIMPAAAPDFPPQRVIERKIIVNNTEIHIKSVFTAQRQFDDALQSIVMRRMSEKRG
jgi:hypothetical protein